MTLMTGTGQGPVAVVDDDPAVLDSLKSFFEAAGYQVGIYVSAMAFLEDRTLRPACLVLDQHMPQMTGLELAAKLRAQGTVIPILLISGALSPAIRARAALIGIEKVLDKPAAEEDLLSFIDAHR
jgi:FixJ family two-component response regulator